MKTKEKILFTIIAIAAIGIGLYPIGYSSKGFRDNGLLKSKSRDLMTNPAYLTALYIHISWGAISIAIGWSQFMKSWRQKHLKFHRYLGYLYVSAVFISSIAGFIIALFSTGGTVASIGFCGLAVAWFTTNLLALIKIKQGKIKEHQNWMMRNYMLTFSAVYLRIYLPIILGCGGSIELALKIVSWLCWVPTMVAMEVYLQRKHNASVKPQIKQKDSFPLTNA